MSSRGTQAHKKKIHVMCLRLPLYMCPHAALCVLTLLEVSPSSRRRGASSPCLCYRHIVSLLILVYMLRILVYMLLILVCMLLILVYMLLILVYMLLILVYMLLILVYMLLILVYMLLILVYMLLILVYSVAPHTSIYAVYYYICYMRVAPHSTMYMSQSAH
jgi:hypothetical protein